MGWLLYVIVAAIFLGILVSFPIPVSLRFDSSENYIKLEWLGFSITKKLERKKPRRPKEKLKKEEKPVIKAIGRLLVVDRYLLFDLLQKGYHLAIDVLHSVSVRELEADFSTPDPMWNGVLSGIFANTRFKNATLTTNFQNINHVRGWLQFHPQRVVRVVAGLVICLPYGRIIRTVLYIKRQKRKEESP